MVWETVRLEDKYNRTNKPFISISRDRITFSALFVRLTSIGTEHRVIIKVDQESMRVGFEFPTENREHSLALVPDNKSQTTKCGLFCSSHGLIKQYDWIHSVTKLDSKDRRFSPRQEGKMWVITICPSFPTKMARESQHLPADAKGIYRYVREGGDIVYIGRGDIAKRLRSPERQDWDFDVVEYSIIPDPDQQVYWESFWIQRFMAGNGRLPVYNKVGGSNMTE